MLSFTLRTKFLLAFMLISALLTFGTLLVVRQRVQLRVREEIADGLRNSVVTFQSLQQDREATLARSAALLAVLPPLKAIMTSRDVATIQDASTTFWKLIGSELFVLSDGSGTLMALHASKSGFTETAAGQALHRSLSAGVSRDWWYGSGRLFRVFLQPIYFGSEDDNVRIGVLAVGYEIDERVAADVSRVAASQVALRYGKDLVVSTVSPQQQSSLAKIIERQVRSPGEFEDLRLGKERFLSTSVALSAENSNLVTLTVLKSYDKATEFLQNLNRWILALGFAAVLAGSVLVFLVSTTFTRPLEQLVAGVHALQRGDYAFPLAVRGEDEVSALTRAFHDMRQQLQESQRQLLDAERLATIGRMASTISHDLRHPLTAIMAYAEFLSNDNITECQRKDFFEEIRIAVNRMTDEISSLLGFSKQRETIRPVYARLGEIVERAIQNVKILPEYHAVDITFSDPEECAFFFDPAKMERVLLNLLFNACEAVPNEGGKIEITAHTTNRGFEVRVSDNGPGIPDSIRDNLFQPFVSYGKEKGTGLGLTVVQKIVHDHGGQVSVPKTSAQGTVFLLAFPNSSAKEANSQEMPTVAI